MSIVSDITDDLRGSLGWMNLIKEAASIIIFLGIWFIFAGVFWTIGWVLLLEFGPTSPGALIFSSIFIGIAGLLFLTSNYVVFMRVLGKSISLALNDSDIEKME